jgi:hypothetical protein
VSTENTELPVARPEELATLDAAIDHALASGDESGIDVLGYGEISSVIRYRFDAGEYACKRLPLFDSQARFEGYRETFGKYLSALDSRGIRVVPSALTSYPRDDGQVAGYCLQPALPGDSLAPARLAAVSSSAEAAAMFGELLDHILDTVGGTVGLDGQLSNWVVVDGELAYLDVTTPMLRDTFGRELLDEELFLASLPWALRRIVRTFMLQDILETYYNPRSVIVDLLGNLYKERLDKWIDPFLALANRRLDKEISAGEVRAYYRSDARTWALLQRLRHADRFWQRKIRRRVYPFLLPGKIER